MIKQTLTSSTIVILFLAISGILCMVLDLQHYAKTAASIDAQELKSIIVRPGQGAAEVARDLHASDLIDQPRKFSLLARLKGLDKRLKAGEYHLAATMPPADILDTLSRGDVALYRLTVPEGFNARQIAKAVTAAGWGPESAFNRAVSDRSLLQFYDIPGDSFEGYLFPDTYLFPKIATPKVIIDAMVKHFRSMIKPQWENRAQELGLTLHQAVTLASIIEKEAGVASEMPVIASVFHNRLRLGMRLQSDPTVIYAIEDFDGNITRKHLKTETPYNTYRIKGLPPGPIASPGERALEAALYPAETDYLYFVSKKDGTHYFSSNINEHNQAVQKYQRGG